VDLLEVDENTFFQGWRVAVGDSFGTVQPMALENAGDVVDRWHHSCRRRRSNKVRDIGGDKKTGRHLSGVGSAQRA
jgi:hypothetical protein